MATLTRYRFGAFRCDSRDRLLFRCATPDLSPCEPVIEPLTPKAFDTLFVLLERAGQVLTREELMKAVWPDTFVEEGSLTRNISALRKALGDDTESPTFIETVPRRGYRFARPVEVEVVTESPDAPWARVTPTGEPVAETSRTQDAVRAAAMGAQQDAVDTPAMGAQQDAAETSDEAVPRARADAGADVDAAADALPLDIAPASANSQAAAPRSRARLAVAAAAVGLAILLVGALAAWSYWGAGGSGSHPALATIRTMAVLPFTTLPATADRGHLGAGIADAVITRLARSGAVQVRPTRTVLSLDERRDVQAIGRQLGVDAILAGTLQAEGDRIRVTLQVISVERGTPVWADSFDDRAADVFQIEDVIAQRVASAWAAPPPDDRSIARRRTTNPEAYELYLRGRYFWSRRTSDSLATAAQWFERAALADPNDALAYAGLADSHALLGWYGRMPTGEAVKQARANAERALAIDAGLSEPHASLGLASCLEWRWDAAEREFRKAIELDPDNATAHQMYGAMFLVPRGRTAEGIAELERARAIDPLSLTIHSNLAAAFHYGRRYDRAIAEHDRVLEIDPAFATARYGLALAYEQQQRMDEAIAGLEQLVRAGALGTGGLTALGHAYAVAGRRAQAREVLAQVREQQERGLASPYMIALVQLGLGLRDEALASLQTARDERSVWFPWCRVDPRFDPLRGDPRFKALLEEPAR